MTDAPAAAPRPARRDRLAWWHRLTANPMTLVGMGCLALVLVPALLAPVLPLADPDDTVLSARLTPPFADAGPLGTDHLGRDLLSRLLWGTQVSVAVGVAATLVAALIGGGIGLLAAFYGRWVDMLLMRSIDALMAFPYLLLALAIVAALGPSLMNALLAISIVNIPFFARAVRGQALAIRATDYIAAARLSGMPEWKIIATEVVPNVVPVIVVTMSTTLSWMILETAGLSFLGLGAQPPTADLGSMLGDGRELIYTAPWVSILPGAVILILAIGINLVGDGVRDLLDPRLKGGALTRPAARTATDLPPAPAGAMPPAAPAPAMVPPLLAVEGLSVEFRATGHAPLRAIRDVRFAIAPGEALGVVGESGSGKSVTALSLLGLVPSPPGVVTGGRVWFRPASAAAAIDLLRQDLRTLQDLRGHRIAYVFQDPLSTLNPVLPVGSQVAETLIRHRGVSHAAARARVIELFELVRLPDAAGRYGAYPHELSGGQRQRVVIAMALANDPALMIADEPTTALDVTTQKRILDLLDDLRRESGTALLLITHDFGVIDAVCDRVQVMYAGEIVETGPTADVLGHPQHPYTQRLLACVPAIGRRRAIEPIEGLPPALDALPPGCAFAPRCHRAGPDCDAGPIAERVLGPGRAARCLRIDAPLAEAAPAARGAV